MISPAKENGLFRPFTLLFAIFASLPHAASFSASNTHTAIHQTFDLGGERSTSVNYTHHASIGGITGGSESSAYVARHGFIGQIHDAPILGVVFVEGVGRTVVTLHGTVNPAGLPTALHFEYGPADPSETVIPLPDLEPDSIAAAVEASLSNLAPGTEYRFRLVATNADGTVRGDGVFSTVENLPPIPGEITLEILPGLPAKIAISNLLAKVSDPEGDSVQLEEVARFSSEGGQVFIDGEWIIYMAPEGGVETDAFAYTVRDSFGAAATGTVLVTIRPDNDAPTWNIRTIETIPGTGGHVRVAFVGVPGRTYIIEATSNLTGPWTTIATRQADESGLYEYIDEDARQYNMHFYRAVRQ